MSQYSTYRRLEYEITNLARSRGLNGSPFQRDDPPLGTRQEEMAAIFLSLDVDRPLTDGQKKLVRRWARNIVLSSSRPQSTADNMRQSNGQADKVKHVSSKPTSAVDRANRTAAKHRSSRRAAR